MLWHRYRHRAGAARFEQGFVGGRIATERLSLARDETVEFAPFRTRLPRSEQVAPFEHDVRACARDDVTATDFTGQDEVAVVTGMAVLRGDGARIPLVPEREVPRRQFDPLLPGRRRVAIGELVAQHLLGRHVIEMLDRRTTPHACTASQPPPSEERCAASMTASDSRPSSKVA